MQSKEIRQIVILAAFFLVAASLLFLYPLASQKWRETRDKISEAPPPAVEEAPAPPPSPLPPGAVILHGALKDVKDLTPLEGVELEGPYQKMVDNVLSLTEEAISSSCEGELPYGTFLKYAPELRGRVFRLSGIPGRVTPVRLLDPIQGHEDVYRIVLMEFEATAAFICDLVTRTRLFDTRWDRIEIEGMFYKVVRYESEQGQIRDAPLLIGRTYREMTLPSTAAESAKLFWVKIVIIIGILAAVTVAYVQIRALAQRRSSKPILIRNQKKPES